MNIDEEKINLSISKFLFEIIEDNTPYNWIYTEEPFYNIYKDKTSYDYSGEVVSMTINELKSIKDNLGSNPASVCYNSDFDELLNTIYIDQWYPTYQSNYGKHWRTYKDLLDDKFNDWKYENFPLYNEETEEYNEELEQEIDNVLYNFLENTSLELYYNKILQLIKNE